MSYSPALHTVAGDPERARHLVLPTAGIVLLVSAGFDALGIWGDGTPGTEPQTGDFLVTLGLSVVAVAVVFGALLPTVLDRTSGAAVALVLAILAVLSVAVFWAGITLALAAGGALLGWARRGFTHGHALAQVAVALSALATVGYVATYVLDWMHTNGVW